MMTATERVYRATRDVLDTRPEMRDAIRAVLETDATTEDWTFETVEVDSGTFGELVSAGIVERTEDGYRVADRTAVQAALEDRPLETITDEIDASESRNLTSALPTMSRPTLLGLIVGVLIVAGVRSVTAPQVFQRGAVVSPANDPYYFRYLQERLLERPGLHPRAVVEVGGGTTRPFTNAANWYLTELFGGGPEAAALVVGWLPVLASVALGVVIFALATRLTRDTRVGVLSTALLIAPVHVVYTSLGFFDHQLHQYFWLGLLLLGGVWLAEKEQVRTQETYVIAVLLAVTIGVTPHVWGGSPLILLPFAAYIGLRAVQDVAAERTPHESLGPLVVATVLGATLAYLPHLAWGWRDAYVLQITALVAIGAIGVTGLASVWVRREWPAVWLLGGEGALALVSLIGFRVLRPEEFSQLLTRSTALFTRGGILEGGSLYGLDKLVLLEPLIQIGPAFFLAVPVLVWVSWLTYRHDDPGWLLLTVFGWYFALLAGFQMRFAGQLSIVLAPFAAMGLVTVLAKLDLVAPVAVLDDLQRPKSIVQLNTQGSWRRMAYVGGAVVLIVAVNLFFLSGLFSSTVYNDEFDAAMAIDDHTEQFNQSYPETYVLSEWGENRMYNYFVNGESRSYGFARSNYGEFITSTNTSAQYSQLADRVGYVTVGPARTPARTTHGRLYDGLGLGSTNVSHFQILYVGESVRAFALVPGATIRVSGPTGQTVTAQTTVDVPSSPEVSVGNESYTQRKTITRGTATLRVAHPGKYQVNGQTVTVSPTAVEEGQSVSINLHAG